MSRTSLAQIFAFCCIVADALNRIALDAAGVKTASCYGRFRINGISPRKITTQDVVSNYAFFPIVLVPHYIRFVSHSAFSSYITVVIVCSLFKTSETAYCDFAQFVSAWLALLYLCTSVFDSRGTRFVCFGMYSICACKCHVLMDHRYRHRTNTSSDESQRQLSQTSFRR